MATPCAKKPRPCCAILRRISADAFKDEATGHSYFQAVVAPEAGEVAGLGGRALVPGMPVQLLFRTEGRTPFGSFVKPMSDYFTKVFREQRRLTSPS